MSRTTPLVTVVAAVGGVALGRYAGEAGWWLAVLLGVALGGIAWAAAAARLRRVARVVGRWVGEGRPAMLELRGSSAWRELRTAVNVLGTQLQETRDELRSLVPWTQRLVLAVSDPALVFGPDGRLAASNDRAHDLLSLTRLGDPPTALGALGSAAMAAAVDEAVDTGRAVALDVELDGRELYLTASPLDDHVLVVIADRTRARRVEALRRDFVTNASHELKTPVTAIAALVDALQVAPDERRAGLVDRLGEESERLVRLVHDLLDLRMLEDTDASGETEPVDLVELVRAAAEDAVPAAREAEVELELELPDRAVVAGTARELRLVVTNLVTNAVQYNQPGGSVHVSLARDGGDQVLVVADTGVGIPRAAVDRVFERFYRVDVARSRDRGGTGLGLSIVRNAVERHGGRVALESMVGAGSTFTVRLPVTPPERDAGR